MPSNLPIHVYGVIAVGGLRDEYPLVQARCHYDVVDVYSIASLVQDYYSSANIDRDVEYVFPLPPSAAVCSFKAVIDDKKTIKGIVKEKGEAKKEYDQAVAQGYTAGLLEQQHADVFRVSLGNIKPKQKISVHISFVSIVSHDGSAPTTLRINMPTAIAPLYGTPPTNLPWAGANHQNRFELSVAFQMSKPVTSVSSPSHPIGLTLGSAQRELQGDYQPSKAFVYLGAPSFLEKDIVIVVSAQGLDAPRCSVERWLASDGAEETTDAYALTLVPKFELPALPQQEYIFLVDRSGSMATGRMNAVKASLQVMLKPLPSRNTTFNIISFGSSFTSLWPNPRLYTAESVEEASKHVDTFTSNYGGTELRTALNYAFDSRAAHKKTRAEDKVPASVFVLTDGGSWDLNGVMELVAARTEGAKSKDCLLRTFVLGVGDQVATAMCEGIARAGKGTAVFVAEGEKPDAKLMSLLKAARGGVIEDLQVDWGVESEIQEVHQEDDDFEMVEEPPAVAAPPEPEAAPINLFDDAPPQTAELGPQKAIVHLSPPPKIQQAPKSDKLPIPLYPGFRCSIFAIVKQTSNPGPHPPTVKITGKVLGREVVLQIPVEPLLAGAQARETLEGGRLVHTLAAKALIQHWEDLPTTPEAKAEIERLGKRYALASSVTSFIALDEEARDFIKSLPMPAPVREVSSSHEVLFTGFQSLLPMRAASGSMRGGRGGAGGPMGQARIYSHRSLQSHPPQQLQLQLQQQMQQQQQVQPVPHPAYYSSMTFGAAPSAQVMAGEALSMGSTRDRGRDQDEDRRDRDRERAPPRRRAPPMGDAAPKVKRRALGRSDAVAPQDLEATIQLSATLSVEALARAQNFDGSFPSSKQHLLSLEPRGGQVPPQPVELTNLGQGQETIWATILTLACLQKKFGGEKDAWEILAEKARAFIDGALQGLGLDEAKATVLVGTMTATALAAF